MNMNELKEELMELPKETLILEPYVKQGNKVNNEQQKKQINENRKTNKFNRFIYDKKYKFRFNEITKTLEFQESNSGWGHFNDMICSKIFIELQN